MLEKEKGKGGNGGQGRAIALGSSLVRKKGPSWKTPCKTESAHFKDLLDWRTGAVNSVSEKSQKVYPVGLLGSCQSNYPKMMGRIPLETLSTKLSIN